MTKINSSPLILSGREVSDEVLKGIKIEINDIKAKNKRLPGLSVILVGDNPASNTYVKNKTKVCEELGIHPKIYKFDTEIKTNELIKIIQTLNKDKTIDGILLQLPLPIHIKPEIIINEIDPLKDVDGLSPINLGKLLSGQDCLAPCTPQGVMKILKHYLIDITGMNAVVIGRSTLVGKPLSMMLLACNATVSIAHSKSENISQITKSADILVCAVGKAKLVKKDWVKPDAVVIDVGINKIIENGSSKLVGDVDFDSVKSVCKAITPVPGGVGPTTVAMLMANTLKAYKLRGDD